MKWKESEKQKYQKLDEKYQKLFREKEELAYELRELKANTGQLANQDAQIRQLHESVRHMKHDMKNHFMVIASYLNQKEYEKAEEYTSKILDKLNAVHSYIETGNSLMSHILNEKLNKARTFGILVKAEIENISFARMESLDFSALLSNILDNAIEASQKEQEKELQVQIFRKRGYEIILVKNKIEESVLDTNPMLITTKENKQKHGIGIQQIKSITEKYEGLCDIYEEDGWFCICVFIPA